MAVETLDPMLPTEKPFIDFDFTNLLKAPIASAVCVVTTFSGPDIGTPLLTKINNVALDPTAYIASQQVQVGSPGSTYLLSCTATATNGDVETIQELLPVVSLRIG